MGSPTLYAPLNKDLVTISRRWSGLKIYIMIF